MKIGILTPLPGIAPSRYFQEWSQTALLLGLGLSEKGIAASLFRPQEFEPGGSQAVFSLNLAPETCEEKQMSSWDVLPVAELFEHSGEYSLLHNFSGALPLTYLHGSSAPLLTTIAEVSPRDYAVWKRYDQKAFYSLPGAFGRLPGLDYLDSVAPGLDLSAFEFNPKADDYLVFCDEIRAETGVKEAVQIAMTAGVRLVMAGAVKNQAFFQKEVKPLLENEQVIYLGEIDAPKQKELMARAQALLYPVKFNEVFPFRVVRAMALGTPALAFRHGGLPEVIDDERTGFLASSLQEAAGLVPRIAGLSRKDCRVWVESKFTVEKMVEGYLKLYGAILESRKREDLRPWGYYRIISDYEDMKVKRILVYPNQRLSLQRHQKRSEHWYMAAGEALVTLEGKEIKLKAGQAVDIPVGSWHRIANPGKVNLEFVEIQTGEYFGEDDIERREDDYARS